MLLGMANQDAVNSITKHTLFNNNDNNTFNDNDIEAMRIYIEINYSVETANRLIKQCMKIFFSTYNCKFGRHLKYKED